MGAGATASACSTTLVSDCLRTHANSAHVMGESGGAVGTSAGLVPSTFKASVKRRAGVGSRVVAVADSAGGAGAAAAIDDEALASEFGVGT